MAQLGFARCEGAPRDLGLDQGRALRDEIRADLGAIGRAAGRSAITRWLSRSNALGPHARHFPHLDERITGLAEAVGCSREDVMALTAYELRTHPATIARAIGAAAALELQSLERLPPTGLAIRKARPDGGYANLTLARPGAVFALAGVNEHGLAGVAQLGRASRAADRCHAPAVLLLEQCIERLDGVEKALEWCERRPSGGVVRFLFADAAGAAAAIEIEGEQRKRVAVESDPCERAEGIRVRVDASARAIEVGGGGVASARYTL